MGSKGYRRWKRRSGGEKEKEREKGKEMGEREGKEDGEGEGKRLIQRKGSHLGTEIMKYPWDTAAKPLDTTDAITTQYNRDQSQILD